MWTDQTSAQLRNIVQAVGSMLLTFGWITQGQLDDTLSAICQFVGPSLMIAGAVWSWRVNRKQAIVASASAIPEVKEMHFSDTELADAARHADPGTIVKLT